METSEKSFGQQGPTSIDTWSQLVSMVFCQFSCCDSVLDISNGLKSATGNLNHLGISRAPSKSTVAYQNSNRSSSVFRDIFYKLYLTKIDLEKWLNEPFTPPPDTSMIT